MEEIVSFVEEHLKTHGSTAPGDELKAAASTLVAEVTSELSAEVASEIAAGVISEATQQTGSSAGA